MTVRHSQTGLAAAHHLRRDEQGSQGQQLGNYQPVNSSGMFIVKTLQDTRQHHHIHLTFTLSSLLRLYLLSDESSVHHRAGVSLEIQQALANM